MFASFPPREESPRPRSVAGYSAAKQAGRIPNVTPTSPNLLPGASARDQLRTVCFIGAGLFLLTILATTVLRPLLQSVGFIVPLVMIGGFCLCWALLSKFRLRLLAELQAGYTTLRLNYGRAQSGRWHQLTTGGGRLNWDYRGTWLLNSAGAVLEEPDFDFDAPGFYPSPWDEGRLEVWTGVSWSGWLNKTPA